MLYILFADYFLADYILEGLAKKEYIRLLRHPRAKRGFFQSVIKYFELKISSRIKYSIYFPLTYQRKLLEISPQDKILLFSLDNYKELVLLRKFLAPKNVSVFLWNPVLGHSDSSSIKEQKKQRLQHLKEIGYTLYTFDKKDAEDHDLQLRPQVYCQTKPQFLNGNKIHLDAFFVGQDKGRLQKLNQLQEVFKKYGLNLRLHVIADKQIKYTTHEKSLITYSSLSYTEYLSLLVQSRSVIELLQSTQSSETIRSLESAFFNKKLITNNISILESDLYDKDRVFILGHDKMESIAAFLNRPSRAPLENSLKFHDIEFWHLHFLEC